MAKSKKIKIDLNDFDNKSWIRRTRKTQQLKKFVKGKDGKLYEDLSKVKAPT
jgi:hypothetical protein